MSGVDLATSAQSLLGTRFRLNGRDPTHGLDCIGLLEAALGRCGHAAPLPNGYSLRISDPAKWLPDPQACGFAPATAPVEAGDVVLLQIGPAQFHLAIHAADGGWIHAHAGLRRVVWQPAPPAGAIVQHWRLAPSD